MSKLLSLLTLLEGHTRVSGSLNLSVNAGIPLSLAGIPTGIPAVETPVAPDLPNLNPVSTSRIVDQIKQRKLLWAKPAEDSQGSGSAVATTDAAESSAKSPPEQTRPGSVQHWAKATFRGEILTVRSAVVALRVLGPVPSEEGIRVIRCSEQLL